MRVMYLGEKKREKKRKKRNVNKTWDLPLIVSEVEVYLATV